MVVITYPYTYLKQSGLRILMGFNFMSESRMKRRDSNYRLISAYEHIYAFTKSFDNEG